MWDISEKNKNQKKELKTLKEVEFITTKGGLCVCPVCGTTASDSRNKPYFQQIYLKCGSSMINE